MAEAQTEVIDRDYGAPYCLGCGSSVSDCGKILNLTDGKHDCCGYCCHPVQTRGEFEQLYDQLHARNLWLRTTYAEGTPEVIGYTVRQVSDGLELAQCSSLDEARQYLTLDAEIRLAFGDGPESIKSVD